MRKSINTNSKKNTIKNNSKNHILIICSLVFAVYFCYTLFSQQIKINKYDSQIEMYSDDINTKKDLINYYESQKSNIKTDEYVESVARETLGYIKPYEKIFIDANR